MSNYKRRYTVTFKASQMDYKGRIELLKAKFHDFLKEVQGNTEEFVIEDRNNNNCHIHALVHCPLIKDKTALAKLFKGWHIHQKIVCYKDYDNIVDIWNKYTRKELSDSIKYEQLFGNAFLDTNQFIEKYHIQ